MKKNALAYIALALVCLIWGTTYLSVRIAVMHFPPFLLVTIRQVSAGVIIIVFLLLSKKSLPNKKHILQHALVGFFMVSMAHGLGALAQLYITSGLAAVICSLMPMLVILINISITHDEKPTFPILFGAILGLIGICMVFSESLGSFSKMETLLGTALTFVGLLSWSSASVWLKNNTQQSTSNPMMNAGIQLFFGGLWLVPVSLMMDDYNQITWGTSVLLPLTYLIVFGSVIAFLCYTYALSKLSLTVVSLYAYINPIVAVLLGWLILNENLNTTIWIGMLITLAGIYIVNNGYRLKTKRLFMIKRSNDFEKHPY